MAHSATDFPLSRRLSNAKSDCLTVFEKDTHPPLKCSRPRSLHLVHHPSQPQLMEEEMQRRQLVALLEQGKKNGGKSPSPRDLQRTFKVDGPERLNVGNNEWDRYKAVVREG